MNKIDETKLTENIDSIIYVLQLIKIDIKEGDYSEAYSYSDGIVNDLEELRNILGELSTG